MCERQQLVQWVNQNNVYIYDPHCEGLKTTQLVSDSRPCKVVPSLLAQQLTPPPPKIHALLEHTFTPMIETWNAVVSISCSILPFFFVLSKCVHHKLFALRKMKDNKLKAFLISGHACQLENFMVVPNDADNKLHTSLNRHYITKKVLSLSFSFFLSITVCVCIRKSNQQLTTNYELWKIQQRGGVD